MSAQGFSDENSPAVAGPDQGDTGTAEQNSQQEIDWQKRYVDTQEAYTRGQQELATFREQQSLYQALLTSEDEDERRQAALQLGYQLEEEDDPSVEDYEDPFEYYDERLGRVEQSLTQQQQEQLESARVEQMQAVIGERLAQLDIDEEDRDDVLAYAIHALPATEEGLPDIKAAYERFQAREVARQRKWAQSKRAPHISPNGQSATEAPDLDDRQSRQDFIVRRMMEGEQAGY